MTTTTLPEPTVALWRRVLDGLVRTAAVALFVLLIGGLLGLVLRDRIPIVAMLMYVPLVPVGIAAIVWDLAAGGRAVRRWRWTLGVLGVVACACGVVTSLSWAELPPAPAAAQPLTVVQWNVRWGGGRAGGDGTAGNWHSLGRDILERAPDVLVLSECPGSDRINDLLRTLGPEWRGIHSGSENGAAYRYRMLIGARWPVALERQQSIPSGFALQAVVSHPHGDLRVLVVDGESPPWFDRTPRLRAVAQMLREATQAGKPINVVAGDFNAVARSVGFGDIADAGFVSADATHRGWRTTWPAVFPMYDIDHVWIERRWTCIAFERFTNPATDHRGQLARLARAKENR